MNAGSYVILAVIVLLAVLAVRYSFKHRNEDCDGCCTQCPYHGKCSKKTKK
ncbi:MAG TPA: hypothetical protein DIV41_00575 [Ruminococcaceae bacterium]|jgi:hypothetical protein|nr:hypothetical protein [Oscillospiraceae bacterium]